MLRRCTSCILPANYPGISFNDSGVCNHCFNYKKREYLGDDLLKSTIEDFLHKSKANNDSSYDCLIGVSGGRDSSYLLYYFTKVLGLRVLAYFVDHGLAPKTTITNIEKMRELLDVELNIEKNNLLKKCIRHHILAWIQKPLPSTIGLLCTGCRYGMDLGLLNCAKRNKIRLIVWGGTPFEGQGYKIRLMSINPKNNKRGSLIMGYFFEILKNPHWISNPSCLAIQMKEFYYHFAKNIFRYDPSLLSITPFASHIHWEEKKVVSTIQRELKWEKNQDATSTWRGDCYVAMLKSYLYRITLGFNDTDDHLSSLIRDGQISREEALKRLDCEGTISETTIEEFLDSLGVSYSHFLAALRRVQFCNEI